jgi:hypothetical protein
VSKFLVSLGFSFFFRFSILGAVSRFAATAIQAERESGRERKSFQEGNRKRAGARGVNREKRRERVFGERERRKNKDKNKNK